MQIFTNAIEEFNNEMALYHSNDISKNQSWLLHDSIYMLYNLPSFLEYDDDYSYWATCYSFFRYSFKENKAEVILKNQGSESFRSFSVFNKTAAINYLDDINTDYIQKLKLVDLDDKTNPKLIYSETDDSMGEYLVMDSYFDKSGNNIFFRSLSRSLFLYSISSGKYRTLSKSVDQIIEVDSTFVYFLKNEKLVRYNLLKKKEEILLNCQNKWLYDLCIKDNRIFACTRNGILLYEEGKKKWKEVTKAGKREYVYMNDMYQIEWRNDSLYINSLKLQE